MINGRLVVTMSFGNTDDHILLCSARSVKSWEIVGEVLTRSGQLHGIALTMEA
jgi:hypothetical protein